MTGDEFLDWFQQTVFEVYGKRADFRYPSGVELDALQMTFGDVDVAEADAIFRHHLNSERAEWQPYPRDFEVGKRRIRDFNEKARPHMGYQRGPSEDRREKIAYFKSLGKERGVEYLNRALDQMCGHWRTDSVDKSKPQPISAVMTLCFAEMCAPLAVDLAWAEREV